MGASLPTQDLPWDDIGVVLHSGDDYFVTLPDVLSPVALGNQVDAFGGSPHEDDLRVLGGVEKLPHLGTCGFVFLGSALAQIVQAPVNVGVFGVVVPCQGVYNHLRLLTGCGVVQVDQRLAVDTLLQNREVLSDPGHVEGAGCRPGGSLAGRSLACGHDVPRESESDRAPRNVPSRKA